MMNKTIVVISPEDYIACDESSRNMWANKKSGMYGKGLNNTDDDPFRVERVGRLGEMGLARLLGTYPDLAYKEGGDSGDIIFNGLSIDTQVAFRNYGCGLIYAINEWGNVITVKSDIYVFGYLKSEDRDANSAEIAYVGWAPRKLIMEQPILPARKGRHKNYEIEYSELLPLSELKYATFPA